MKTKKDIKSIYANMTKKGWFQTDASSNQYGKKVSKMVYLFREEVEVNPVTHEIARKQAEIDLTDYTLKEMYDAMTVFDDYTLEHITEMLEGDEDSNRALIAECLFEMCWDSEWYNYYDTNEIKEYDES
jgi:hypothetical protein